MKKTLIILILITAMLLTSCFGEYEYSGDYPELFSVSINSLLWTMGQSYGADFVCDPEIKIIEQDQYGRILFEYEEAYFGDLEFKSLLIMQHSDENRVYYYEDINFISKEIDGPNVVFDAEDIEALKLNNDWGKEVNLEKCVKKEISQSKEDPPVEEAKFDEIFSDYEGYSFNRTYLSTQDEYGRYLCHSRIRITNGDTYSEKYVVVLFQTDLSYLIMEPSSILEYQNELKEFKELNNWNCAVE